jgi:hypothetical protein
LRKPRGGGWKRGKTDNPLALSHLRQISGERENLLLAKRFNFGMLSALLRRHFFCFLKNLWSKN